MVNLTYFKLHYIVYILNIKLMKICLGYPQEEAAIVALKAIRDFLEHDHNLVTYFKFLH